MKAIPPYGRDFSLVPNTGVQVAIGPGAWLFASVRNGRPNGWRIPIMVLPVGEAASSFAWPSDGGPALIHERGDYNDKLLDEMASELLKVGASSVVAIREALLIDYDPRVFYDSEVINAAA